MFAVLDRLFKRFRKIFGYQQSKIRIVCFMILCLVSMSVNNREAIFIIFCGHLAGWIAAEDSYFIVKCRRIIYKFRLIQTLIQFLHDLISDFHTDTYVNGSDFSFNSICPADIAEPF